MVKENMDETNSGYSKHVGGLKGKKIDSALERITKEMKIVGVMKRKSILGSFFKTIERDDAEIVKTINKRIKLEKDKIAKEQALRIKNESLESQIQTTEKIETENIRDNEEKKVEKQNDTLNST